MANDVQITSNTILKLLVRRGTDTERQNITLTEGELGYTVDTKRVFVGDGATAGGIPIANTFLGFTVDPTTVSFGAVNDLIYETDAGLLRALAATDYTDISSWTVVGGPGSTWVDDESIQNTSGILSIKTVSGSHLDTKLFGTGLELDGYAMQVQSSLSLDSINKRDTDDSIYLTIPAHLQFNNNGSTRSYTFPTGGLSNGFVLKTDPTGVLSWGAAEVLTDSFFVSEEMLPVGSIIPFPTDSPPSGFLLCNGQEVLSSAYTDLYAAIGVQFGIGLSAGSFMLPNYTGRLLFGVDNIGDIGDTYNVTTTAASASLSASAVFWLMKWKPDVINSAKITLGPGLTAYNESLSAGTTTINLSSEYGLGIDEGLEDGGNVTIINAVNKARRQGVSAFTSTLGGQIFTVPDNTYQIKVTATGGGGVAFKDAVAYGYTGGSGSTIVAYLCVYPGQDWDVFIGDAGTSGGNPATASTFGYNSTTYLSAGGARFDGATAAAGQTGGFTGGIPILDLADGVIMSWLSAAGGRGGFDAYLTENTFPGAASHWGSAPAYGGGGGGEGRTSTTEIQTPGNGVCIVELLQ